MYLYQLEKTNKKTHKNINFKKKSRMIKLFFTV